MGILRALVALLLLACTLPAPARQSTEQRSDPGRTLREAWVGAIRIGPMEALMQLRIYTDAAGGTSAYFDSITEGRTDFEATWSLEDRTLGFDVESIMATWRGQLDAAGQTAVGHFTQGGRTLELTLRRQDAVYDNVNVWANRPQRPRAPFPYSSTEVTFPGPDASVTLAGTLTLPAGDGPHPAVILVSGSGQQDRDETLLEHKPFLVLADHLGRRGIAVLRYDDRGTAFSTGNFALATTADFADDAERAFDFLLQDARIDPARIAMLGHSEGGLIAPMLAARRADLAAIVLLAAPGVPGERISRSQSDALTRAAGGGDGAVQLSDTVLDALFSVIKGAQPGDDLAAQIEAAVATALLDLSDEQRELAAAEREAFRAMLPTYCSPWFRFFVEYDPAPTLAAVRCPVLALNGAKDLQVLPGINLLALAATLTQAGHADFEIVELPGLNHLFQACETGSPREYRTIPETLNPAALEAIDTWLGPRLQARTAGARAR